MSVEVLQVLQLFITVAAVIGVAVGWYKSGKSRGAYEAAMRGRIKQLESDAGEIKHIIGNGGFGGIRADIQSIKLNCAGEMAVLKTKLEALVKGDEV